MSKVNKKREVTGKSTPEIDSDSLSTGIELSTPTRTDKALAIWHNEVQVYAKNAQRSALATNTPLLAFSKVQQNQASFLVLTVYQQDTDTPVKFTTDSPTYFQLASDSHPTFSSGLLLRPSPSGTYVHVRYFSEKAGLHTGNLLIETLNAEHTITLQGQSANRVSGLISGRKREEFTSGQRVEPSKKRRWLQATGALLVASLAFGGYSNRCQLFPDLCESTTVVMATKNTATDAPSQKTPTSVPSAAAPVIQTTHPLNKLGRPKKARLESEQAPPTRYSSHSQRPVRPESSLSSETESDLEKELNRN